MKFHRKERMESLLAEELSKLLLETVEIPGALVTITRVEVGDDLEQAKVFVSILPSHKSREAVKRLSSMAGELHFTLIRKLNIRPVPRIAFKEDEGPALAAEIEKKLREENNGEVEEAQQEE